MQDKKNHRFYAACPWGLEAVLEEELAACGAKRSRKTPSGVMFEGTIETAYLACLRSRIASRVMMEVSFHDYWDSRDIYEQALAFTSSISASSNTFSINSLTPIPFLAEISCD